MEIQVYGTSCNPELDLKLRAAGATDRVQFRVHETVWSVPSSVSGAVSGKVRLIQHEKDDSWVMVHEAEISKDREDTIKAVAVDKVILKGDAEVVLKNIGFVQEFHIGRSGSRFSLPNGWILEYFNLFDPKSMPKSHKSNTSHGHSIPSKPMVWALESGGPGYLVTLTRSFQHESEIEQLYSDAWRILRRLSPELKTVTISSIETDGRKDEN